MGNFVSRFWFSVVVANDRTDHACASEGVDGHRRARCGVIAYSNMQARAAQTLVNVGADDARAIPASSAQTPMQARPGVVASLSQVAGDC